MCYISRRRGAVNAGCRGKSSPGKGSRLRVSFRGAQTFPEESPDCKERGVLSKGRIPRTISRGKTSATESIPPPESCRRQRRKSSGGKGEMAGQEPAGRRREPRCRCKLLPQQDQIGNEPLLFGVMKFRVLVAQTDGSRPPFGEDTESGLQRPRRPPLWKCFL